jgi:hypothetical protein
MRPFLTILSFLATNLIFSQSLSDKYLHFRTDYYWDTTLYKSEQDYYYDLSTGKITQKEYPVLQYMFTNVISDTPLVTKDAFERRGWSDYPYKYIRKGNNIYLQYFDLGKRKLQLNKEYSLNGCDTVKWLAEKNSLDSKDGISVGGFSTYLGEETVEVSGKQFEAFRFLEDHDQLSSHPSHYTKEVFLEKTKLIPIKFVETLYDYKTRQRKLYSSVTLLVSSSNSLPDYTNKKTDDLVLYEDKSTQWTQQQINEFLKKFPPDKKEYAECLLKKLNGHISFYHFEQSIYFKHLIGNRGCE